MRHVRGSPRTVAGRSGVPKEDDGTRLYLGAAGLGASRRGDAASVGGWTGRGDGMGEGGWGEKRRRTNGAKGVRTQGGGESAGEGRTAGRGRTDGAGAGK